MLCAVCYAFHPTHAVCTSCTGRLDRLVFCGFPDAAERLAILQAAAHKLALSSDVDLDQVADSTAGFTGADLAAILSEAQLLAVHDQLDKQQQQLDKQQQLEQQQQVKQQQQRRQDQEAASLYGSGAQAAAADAAGAAAAAGVDTPRGTGAPGSSTAAAAGSSSSTINGGVAGSSSTNSISDGAARCAVSMAHVQRALSRARPSLPPSERRRLEAVYNRFQQSRDPGLSNRPALPGEEQQRIKHATLA